MHVSGTALSLSVCMSNRQQKSPLNADGSAHGLPEVWRGYHAANRALFWSRGASPAGRKEQGVEENSFPSTVSVGYYI